jgi:hypothetical protein
MTELKTPSFNRQKSLLLLLREAGGRLTRTDFQKLLFLANIECEEPHFEFVPYRYGSYSFQAADDLEILERLGWIALDSREITTLETLDVQKCLPTRDVSHIVRQMKRYQKLRGKKLIRYVYNKYPYYALKSEIAEEVLDAEGCNAIKAIRKKIRRHDDVVFTVGYEGRKLETYINLLIQNDVRVLADVRCNPLSRKFGFSKRALQSLLPKLGIEYRHLPELGIVSSKRRGLSSHQEFKALFREYRNELPNRTAALSLLKELIAEHSRVALTCFEANHRDCHRHCISDYFEKNDSRTVIHL